MEWAVLLSTGDEPDGLRFLGNGSAPSACVPFQVELAPLVEQHWGRVEFSRVYWGNEFCQRLIPTLNRLQVVYAAVAEQGLGFTLVTPYVTDAGLEKLRPLFRFLAAQGGDVEVVVNDWGVLNLLRREYPRLKPVLGRLMNKMLRDPRVAGYFNTPEAPRAALLALQQSSATARTYRRLLQRYGIERVELDNLFQGIALHLDQWDLKGSLYIPYGCVATGRACMIGSLHLPKKLKFCADSTCRQECRDYVVEYRYSDSPFPNKEQRFFQRGNTVFYVHTEEMLARALTSAPNQGICRIVYQPGLPMG